ncbi:MAG: phytanoyl-CoA dioxygenase family protein [Fimbriimonadaceae bacterium]|nr:phytanoyl-CoA dioxygenase family protein [Fimbriimonadaceae bacterium]
MCAESLSDNRLIEGTMEPTVDPNQVAFYQREGYLLVRGLFRAEETDFLRDYFMDMVERGGDGWAEGGVHPESDDPLKRYPRLLQPHRNDEVAMKYMVDERIRTYLTSFYDREPLAVQTMIYFKPPGAKGQALHQDQRYLRADPGTCMAAWLALDEIDQENGGLVVVPGTQDMPMLCPGDSDTRLSFTGEEVPVPQDLETVPMDMKPGDVLFFNGSLVHGSGPNVTKDRFRRIIVGHYIEGLAERVAHYYFPVYRFDGSTVATLEANSWGGPCGVFVDQDGKQVIEMVGSIEEARAAH